MQEPLKLFNGDCIEVMRTLPSGSVDMVLTDLPYGVLNKASEGGSWDSAIPMEPLWEQFLRVAKRNAAIVLFAQGMFTARLMTSQPNIWRYNLVWDKRRSSGFLNANRMPLRRHEDICVFYRAMPTYNAQLEQADAGRKTHSRGRLLGGAKNSCYGKRNEVCVTDKEKKFPGSILAFKKPAPTETVHPTQKSVDLCRWLIRTYTDHGETVLDATMGSGTTGVAAVLEDRGFVGIEKDERYFDVAKDRIKKALAAPRQMELFARP